MTLNQDFYQRKNVVQIARDLLGKGLFTNVNGKVTGGMIVETEAYSWTEKGCHAFGKRKTDRNAIVFGEGGHAYVYLCYGIHYLFNVVTSEPDLPDAVLIRAIQPMEGKEEMTVRRGRIASPYHLTSGPGKLSRALGIDRTLNGKSLINSEVWIEDLGKKIARKDIDAGPRIGIDYAGEDAFLPWRFTIKQNPWISR